MIESHAGAARASRVGRWQIALTASHHPNGMERNAADHAFAVARAQAGGPVDLKSLAAAGFVSCKVGGGAILQRRTQQ